MSEKIKERRLLLLSASVLLAALAALWPGDVARAQESIRDGLLACSKIGDQSSRMDCFDAMVANLSGETAPVPDQATPAVAAGSVEETAPVPDQTTPAVAAGSVAAAAPSRVAPPQSPLPEPLAPPRPASSEPASPAKFGSENVRRKGSDAVAAAKKKREEQLVAAIVSLKINPYGHFIVELDNGQVWRETDGSHVRLSKKHHKVTIFRGRFGGYRMRIEGVARLAWVRRLK